MGEKRYSVRLLFDVHDAAEVAWREPTLILQPGVVTYTLGGGFKREDPEPVWITIELMAADEHHARVLAQHLANQFYVRAGFEQRELPEVWVALMSDDEASSHRFLAQARDLLDQELYELAVVAAQIHLEVQVGTLVRHAASLDSSAFSDAAVDGRRMWAPGDRWVRPLLEAALGRPLESFGKEKWQEYDKHYSRRSGVVHSGAQIKKKDAMASVALAEELWLWLNQSAHAAAAPSLAPPAPPVQEQLELF